MINYEPIPILFEIGKVKFHSWGLMFFLAILISSFLFYKKSKISKKNLYGLLFYTLFGAIIGARIMYVFFNFNYFMNNLLKIFALWDGGLISYGGIIGGLIFAYIYAKKLNLNSIKMLNIASPYIALGFSITRIGCFLNWCCYGIASTLPWAIKVGTDVARHPTQLYLSLINFVIFLVLLGINNYKIKGIKPKYAFFIFLMLYSSSRFLISFIKEVNLFTQIFFFVIFVLSIIMIYIPQKFKKNEFII